MRSPAASPSRSTLNCPAERPPGRPTMPTRWTTFSGRASRIGSQTGEKWAETLSLFEHALALDPHSVEAQSQVANMLALRAGNRMGASPAADLQRAEELVGQALAEWPQNWLAH